MVKKSSMQFSERRLKKPLENPFSYGGNLTLKKNDDFVHDDPYA